jgi:Rho guanine nucleotide exchange factor 11
MGTGNCFYVSMPAGPLDSSTDPAGAPTSSPQSDSLPAWQTEPLLQLQRGNGDQRHPLCSPPNLALRDVGMIFRTIEQLTLKLNRLKVRDMERGPSIHHPGLFPKNEVCLPGSPTPALALAHIRKL